MSFYDGRYTRNMSSEVEGEEPLVVQWRTCEHGGTDYAMTFPKEVWLVRLVDNMRYEDQNNHISSNQAKVLDVTHITNIRCNSLVRDYTLYRFHKSNLV